MNYPTFPVSIQLDISICTYIYSQIGEHTIITLKFFTDNRHILIYFETERTMMRLS